MVRTMIGKLIRNIETIENELYKEICKDEVEFELITFDMLFQFYIEQRKNIKEAKKCIVSVEKDANNMFQVKQIILDANNEPIKKTNNSYYGRSISGKYLDEELTNFMDGKDIKLLD